MGWSGRLIAALVVVGIFAVATTPAWSGIGTDGVPEDRVAPAPIELERALHDAVNAHRVSSDLDPLVHDEGLAAIAREHSKDMHDRGYFAHRDPDGFGPGARVGGHCTMVGENLALTYWDRSLAEGAHHTSVASLVDDVLTRWANSPTHRELLERPIFARQGIGVSIEDETGRVYVTQKLCPGP